MGDGKVAEPSRIGRALLTTVAVASACGALGLVAAMETNSDIGPVQASGLIYVLGVAVALRILVNQLRSTQATRDAQDALEAKEAALRETDKALARLQRRTRRFANRRSACGWCSRRPLTASWSWTTRT
jgi:hypothetical protein